MFSQPETKGMIHMRVMVIVKASTQSEAVVVPLLSVRAR
jgi:hypothetical protein